MLDTYLYCSEGHPSIKCSPAASISGCPLCAEKELVCWWQSIYSRLHIRREHEQAEHKQGIQTYSEEVGELQDCLRTARISADHWRKCTLTQIETNKKLQGEIEDLEMTLKMSDNSCSELEAECVELNKRLGNF